MTREVGMTRYDRIGQGYARSRQEDPTLRAAIWRALGEAQTVLNVGAGAGSYEPLHRHVIAVEPSDVMAAQRPATHPPAIRGVAEALPLRDHSVDAAMTVLSVHHWADPGQGIREMRRVSRGPVVVATCDTRVSGEMWLMRDYLPENAALDERIFPSIDDLVDWLGGAEVVPVDIRRDSPDWNLMSFWAHPERVFDADARAATSGFARQPAAVVDRVVRALRADLDSGVWHDRNGHLLDREALDVGLRLVVAR